MKITDFKLIHVDEMENICGGIFDPPCDNPETPRFPFPTTTTGPTFPDPDDCDPYSF